MLTRIIEDCVFLKGRGGNFSWGGVGAKPISVSFYYVISFSVLFFVIDVVLWNNCTIVFWICKTFLAKLSIFLYKSGKPDCCFLHFWAEYTRAPCVWFIHCVINNLSNKKSKGWITNVVTTSILKRPKVMKQKKKLKNKQNKNKSTAP